MGYLQDIVGYCVRYCVGYCVGYYMLDVTLIIGAVI